MFIFFFLVMHRYNLRTRPDVNAFQLFRTATMCNRPTLITLIMYATSFHCSSRWASCRRFKRKKRSKYSKIHVIVLIHAPAKVFKEVIQLFMNWTSRGEMMNTRSP